MMSGIIVVEVFAKVQLRAKTPEVTAYRIHFNIRYLVQWQSCHFMNRKCIITQKSINVTNLTSRIIGTLGLKKKINKNEYEKKGSERMAWSEICFISH